MLPLCSAIEIILQLNFMIFNNGYYVDFVTETLRRGMCKAKFPDSSFCIHLNNKLTEAL